MRAIIRLLADNKMVRAADYSSNSHFDLSRYINELKRLSIYGNHMMVKENLK